MPLTAEELRARRQARRRTKDSEVPELGTVRLQALPAGDAVEFQAGIQKEQSEGRDGSALMFDLVARSWIDADGNPLFPIAEGVAEARALAPKDFEHVLKDVLLLNGMSKEAVAEAEKNS